MLAVGAALIVVYLVVGVGLARATAAGVSFLPTYSAARSVAQGHPSDMYDRPAELRAHAAILPGRPTQLSPYLNPPAAALVVAPLTRLPFASAYVVWAALQTLLLVIGALLLVRGRRPHDLLAPAVLCLGGMWCALDVVLGEWDGVTLLGLALCWRWRAQDRAVAAGLALGILGGLSKPHLLIGVAVYLVVRREWRLVAAAAAGAVTVLVVPALALSPHLLGYDPALLLPFLVPILADRHNRPVLVALLLLLDVASWLDLGNITLFPPGRLTTPLLCVLAGWWLWESRAAALPEVDRGEAGVALAA